MNHSVWEIENIKHLKRLIIKAARFYNPLASGLMGGISALGKANKTLKNMSLIQAVIKAENVMVFPGLPQCPSAFADILRSPLQLQFFEIIHDINTWKDLFPAIQ